MHSFKMRLAPPPGGKFIREWNGKKIRTKRDLTNGWGTVKAGTVCTVSGGIGGVGLTLKADSCPCCGLRALISRVHSSDVEVVD